MMKVRIWVYVNLTRDKEKLQVTVGRQEGDVNFRKLGYVVIALHCDRIIKTFF